MKRTLFFLLLIAFSSVSAQPKALVYDKPFPPSVVMSALLDAAKGIGIANENGMIRFNGLTVTFLPDKEEGGGAAKYGAQPDQHKLSAVLTQGGAEKATFVFETQSTDGPFTRCSPSTNAAPAVVSYSFTQSGDCRLTFLIDGKPFYDFPFSVIKKENADKYAEVKARYFFNGMWSDYGFLVTDQTSGRGLRWAFFHQQEELETPTATKEYAVDIELYKGGKLIGGIKDDKGQKSYQPLRLKSKRMWQREDNTLFLTAPQGKSGKALNAPADLTDGKYEIRMTYYDTYEWENGKPSKVVAGPFQKKAGADVFAFEVAGGKIQYQDRQVRDKTPPAQYIEGGDGEWWIKRK